MAGIDLFAGAGGLSEGFIQAGFSPVAHVEMNPYAAQTLETRTGYYYLKAQGKLDIYKDYISGKITRDEFLQHIPEEQLQSVFCETMSNETLPRLFENIDRILTQRGIKQVDVIIGGPPCQAYSLVGRAQSKHMETPMSADPRNDLYKLYARFLQKYHPKMFVFENVMGIKSANSGATWLKVQEALRSVGYEIECHEQNSKNFGVLQNRRRMIIVGWLKNTGLSYTLITAYVNNKRKNPESDIAGMMFQVNLRAYSQDKMDIFVAEHICRKILAVDEFYFAQRPILGRGRGCAATWKANKNGRASEIVSTFIPEYEFPGVSAALEGFDPFFFSMRTLSVAKKKDDIINRLNVLANSYEDWIQKKLIHDSKMDDAKFKKEIGDTVINKCIEALGRIRAGIQLLVEDDTAFDAFCFMNRYGS